MSSAKPHKQRVLELADAISAAVAERKTLQLADQDGRELLADALVEFVQKRAGLRVGVYAVDTVECTKARRAVLDALETHRISQDIVKLNLHEVFLFPSDQRGGRPVAREHIDQATQLHFGTRLTKPLQTLNPRLWIVLGSVLPEDELRALWNKENAVVVVGLKSALCFEPSSSAQ